MVSNAIDMSSKVGTDNWQLNLAIREKLETLQRYFRVKRKINFSEEEGPKAYLNTGEIRKRRENKNSSENFS